MKYLTILASVLLSSAIAFAADGPFERGLLQDKTLRVDYIFTGTDKTAEISLEQMSYFDNWYGRRVNMTQVPVLGNGDIVLRCESTGEILYKNSFSTLFQEWQTSEEAASVKKSFENVFLLPMPAQKASVTVTLYDYFNKPVCSFCHAVDPSDILIRRTGLHPAQSRYLLQSGSSKEKIDVAFVSEGYTLKQKNLFYKDAKRGVEALMTHEPFKSMADSFNFIAIFLPSRDEGVSTPHDGRWLDTAVSSNFDTFYSKRYLTTLELRKLHEGLAGLPYEHLIILANTEEYGGGGIYNSYTLTSAHHKTYAQVLVHEFGHSFGALADEYYYDDQYVNYYYPGTEPWEQNITTLTDFGSKWEDMLSDKAQPMPTPEKYSPDPSHIGLYEGGGYMSKGVYRPCWDCRMRTNEAPEFCPVCRRAIERIILFNTQQ